MNSRWYINRLRKMGLVEVLKRLREYKNIYYSQLKYRTIKNWPYCLFASDDIDIVIHSLPETSIPINLREFQIFNNKFDLTKQFDWYFSDKNAAQWPFCHYAKINYRTGNPYGDIRINWELNRLQFLPMLAANDENLAKNIIIDWMVKNPYCYGPGYLSSMEIALRWISIYRAICLFKQPLDKTFQKSLCGLIIAGGKFIENHLSTHSSAGNHLIVEATGLLWLGKAIQNHDRGMRWITMARKILLQQICRQINPDGSNKEQSFWYLGFVLDAIYHYFLIRHLSKINPINTREGRTMHHLNYRRHDDLKEVKIVKIWLG